MKKRVSIPLIMLSLALAAYTQVDDSAYMSHQKQFQYLLRITTMDGKRIMCVLSRFELDTVFVFDYDKKGSFRVIENEEESAVAVSSIKSLFIQKNRRIVTNESFKTRKRQQTVLRIIGGTALVAGGLLFANLAGPDLVSEAVVAAAFLGREELIWLPLNVAERGKKFNLNGDKIGYNKMLEKLSGKGKITIKGNTAAL